MTCPLLSAVDPTLDRQSVPASFGREPPAHGVLGHAAGQQEFEQVVGPAGLGADPRELEPAERLAVDQGPGDPAVDVEVADAELAADPLDVGRAARIEAAGEGILGAVGDPQGVVQVLRP